MPIIGSSTGKKRVTVGIIVVIVIVVLAGIVLWVSHTRSNHGRPSPDIALAVAKTVYSNNARAFQGLFSDNPDKANFVQQVSQRVQKYGPVKEVVLTPIPPDPPRPDGRPTFGGPQPGLSRWKVVAERGDYVIDIQVEDGKLVVCSFNLLVSEGGWIGTGSM